MSKCVGQLVCQFNTYQGLVEISNAKYEQYSHFLSFSLKHFRVKITHFTSKYSVWCQVTHWYIYILVFIGITQLHHLLRSAVIAKTRHTVLHKHLLSAIKPQRLAYSSVGYAGSDHSPRLRGRSERQGREIIHYTGLFAYQCLFCFLPFLPVIYWCQATLRARDWHTCSCCLCACCQRSNQACLSHP